MRDLAVKEQLLARAVLFTVALWDVIANSLRFHSVEELRRRKTFKPREASRSKPLVMSVKPEKEALPQGPKNLSFLGN